MALFIHNITSLDMAKCACACLIFTSFVDVPSLVCVDPKYLNWPTSSSALSFIQMLVDLFLNTSCCQNLSISNQ